MTIAENLLQLNETKQAIKTAIEGKGQDLTDIPFTRYAEKITAIEGEESVIVEPLTVTANGTYVGGEVDGKRVAYNPVSVNVEFPVKPLTVTENGTYTANDGEAFNPVTVEVPLPVEPLTVTENGVYEAEEGKGFNVVNVDVKADS